MTNTNDLSGIQSPRLGLGYDSGWAHLSGKPQGDSMSGIDFDEIAAQAASEVFGRAGGGHPFVRGAYAAGRASTRGRPGHPYIRAAYQAGRASAGNPGYDDYYRAGWGAPGWDGGSEGGGYYEDPSLEDQELAEEEDALRDDEYGLDADEFGRFGHKRRQHRRQNRRQNRRSRREHRRATRGAPSWDAGEMDAYRQPLGMEMMEEEPDPYYIFEEEEYGGYDPQDWHGRRGGPVVAEEERYGQYQPSTWHGRRGGPVVVAEEKYGEAPVSAPTQEKSSFRTSLETGLGVGLGMMGAIVAVNLVARAFSGRR